MNTIGKNIKQFREEAGCTQEQMAESLNVTRQAVSNWENGKTEPDINTLDKIANYFNLSVEDIIYGKRARQNITNVTNITKKFQLGPEEGLGFGAILAVVISYVKWHSIGWAILHGALNWVYVIYFLIKYGN